MFERLRSRWTEITRPLISGLGNTDPNLLTWSSLGISLVAFYLIASADLNSVGSWMIFGSIALIGLAGALDALDGDLARHQGTDGPYGDFLDHTIDRVVDIGLIVAIGFNADFGVGPSLGLGAALLTLLGSYMGTQAQSVGLGRIYGGFSRADRMLVTLAGMLLAGLQAAGVADLSMEVNNGLLESLFFGLDEINGYGFAVVFSAWGGIYTFISRFRSASKMLKESVPES